MNNDSSSVRCPICKSDCRFLFNARDVNRGISPETFDYYRCLACALIFLAAVPADLARYYPNSYYSIPPSLDEVRRQANGQRFKIELVQSLAQNGRLLEIGPGTGGFAYLAKHAGFTVEAVEMDSRCCEFLLKSIGVQAIQHSDVPTALNNLGQYDVIAMWQVIEHLADPWSALTSVSEHLVEGGMLFVSTPNPDAFQFRLMSRWWPHVDAPRHLWLIPRRVLTTEGAKRHLTPVSVTANDLESQGWDRFGWVMAATNLLGHNHDTSLLFKIFRALLRHSGAALSVLTRTIERSDFRGSSYTIAFRKETPQYCPDQTI